MAKDLKDTLNLPQTNFPMRGNLVQREPERIEPGVMRQGLTQAEAARMVMFVTGEEVLIDPLRMFLQVLDSKASLSASVATV